MTLWRKKAIILAVFGPNVNNAYPWNFLRQLLKGFFTIKNNRLGRLCLACLEESPHILVSESISKCDPTLISRSTFFFCFVFFNTHLGYSFNFTFVYLCQIMFLPTIPLPSGGIVGENRSTRRKTTVRNNSFSDMINNHRP